MHAALTHALLRAPQADLPTQPRLTGCCQKAATSLICPHQIWFVLKFWYVPESSLACSSTLSAPAASAGHCTGKHNAAGRGHLLPAAGAGGVLVCHRPQLDGVAQAGAHPRYGAFLHPQLRQRVAWPGHIWQPKVGFSAWLGWLGQGKFVVRP